MRRKFFVTALLVSSAILLGIVCSLDRDDPVDPGAAYGQLARMNRVQKAYVTWADQHQRDGGDHNVMLRLGWSKALSKEYTTATGIARLDLIDGIVDVSVAGLDSGDVWLVDNQPGPRRTTMPEVGDEFVRAGSLSLNGETATLHVDLGQDVFTDFEVDRVVVTASGGDPADKGILYGSGRLFQRLYTKARSGRLRTPSAPGSYGLAQAFADEVFPTFDALIIEGAELFFEEKFSGNGRTCGTCHPAENNLTIDPAFIATLKKNDKLFVAENVLALKKNFENPLLMRSLGLILENTNGFGDLENEFTMRGVPHTLGLSTSLTPALGVPDGTSTPPDQRTGWSGDGAPGSGTLRDFATGAVIQHFPKTTDRISDEDFVLPNDDQLDAMEAFQLFTGRDEDPDIDALNFNNPVVARGRDLFNTTDSVSGTVVAGKCSTCHSNGGATVAFDPGVNFNFNTGVEDLPDSPADLVDPANNPDDDGFGSPGLGSFNTPPVVEAADTPPFFHNNSIRTLEGAVDFYTTAAFEDSPAGQFLIGNDTGGVGIELETTHVESIAAFLRVLNVLENLRSVVVVATFALDVPKSSAAKNMLKLSLFDLEDAKEVLEEGDLHLETIKDLDKAHKELTKASKTNNTNNRNNKIQKGLNKIENVLQDILY